MDDVRAFESLPIDIGFEEQRVRVFFPDLRIQFAVDRNVERLAAVSALGFEFNGKLLSSEAPLHEGRSERILRSSTVGALSGTELQAMRRGLAGDWKCPTDFSSVIANQEEEVAFEIFHNGMNPCGGQAERGCHPVHVDWPPIFIGQLANREVAHQVMFGCHEGKLGRKVFGEFGHRGLEVGVRHPLYLLSAAHKERARVQSFGFDNLLFAEHKYQCTTVQRTKQKAAALISDHLAQAEELSA